MSGGEVINRRLSWRRIITSHKHTLLWPIIVVSLFFIFLNSKMRYIVEDPNYRRFWQPVTSASPGSTSSNSRNILSDSEPATPCPPKTNVVFLKTHKCAGSTVQNVFMRFGDQRNLTFVLPRTGNYLGHPEPFNSRFIPDPVKYNVTYNLLVHHNRFNPEATFKLMPRDTVYVTVLRDPVDLFESMYSYYGMFSFYKLPLERLGLLPKQSSLLRRRSSGKFGINQMLFDLGFDPAYFANTTAVDEYVAKLDKIFGLVMISDRMDESLILLKELLCWNTSDIVVFKLNARNSRFKTKLSSIARNRLKKLNSADEKLYAYFTSKLEKRVEEFGRERMSEELAALQKETDFWYRKCVKKPELLKMIKTAHQREANPRVMAYMPTNDSNYTCRSLTLPELEFTDHLRAKQTFYVTEARTIKTKEANRKAALLRSKNLNGINNNKVK